MQMPQLQLWNESNGDARVIFKESGVLQMRFLEALLDNRLDPQHFSQNICFQTIVL
jgi:hypothetical protein